MIALMATSSAMTLLLGLVVLQFLGEMAPFLTSDFCYMIYVMMQCREDGEM